MAFFIRCHKTFHEFLLHWNMIFVETEDLNLCSQTMVTNSQLQEKRKRKKKNFYSFNIRAGFSSHTPLSLLFLLPHLPPPTFLSLLCLSPLPLSLIMQVCPPSQTAANIRSSAGLEGAERVLAPSPEDLATTIRSISTLIFCGLVGRVGGDPEGRKGVGFIYTATGSHHTCWVGADLLGWLL